MPALGRVSYYDNAGVFRDMLQSHLMEMMSLLTMSTETDGKVELLNSVAQIKNSDVLIGQYQGYLEEVSEEKGESISKTPTFAVAKIGVENPNWKSVPIFLSSGKRMDERVGYARVVFKTMPRRNKLKRDCTNVASQVIFYVGHGSLGTPAILVHKSLPLRSNYLPVGWLDTERFHNATLFGAKANCFRIFTPAVDKDAYTFLIEQLYMGNKMYFVTNKSLVESWRIWTPVLKMKLHPKVYPPGILSATSLRYKVTDHNLQFSKKYEQAQSLLSNLFLKRCNIKPFVIPFLGQYATIGPMSYVIKELAEDLELATLANLKESFHVALSGGSSPLYLYEYIIQNKRTSIPWEKMNIWQADERCSAEHSNFRYLEEILLGNITIDPTRVHPMLARIEGHVCSNEAVQNYQEEIQKNVCNGNRCSFHFILLGMGSDGHTASIFPYNEGVYENKSYVTVVNVTARDVVSPQRMTLTLKTINDSKHIAILITGRNKCRILKELTQLKKCGTYDVPGGVIEKYPICGVVLENRVVRWYIVEDAQSCMM